MKRQNGAFRFHARAVKHVADFFNGRAYGIRRCGTVCRRLSIRRQRDETVIADAPQSAGDAFGKVPSVPSGEDGQRAFQSFANRLQHHVHTRRQKHRVRIVLQSGQRPVEIQK